MSLGQAPCGVSPTTNTFGIAFSPKLALIEDEPQISPSSRFSHCCNRCTPRHDASSRYFLVEDLLQKEFLEETKGELLSAGDYGVNLSQSFIENDEGDYGDSGAPVSTISVTVRDDDDGEEGEVLVMPAPLSSPCASLSRATLSPLTGFRRGPPLSRLHPPKL